MCFGAYYNMNFANNKNPPAMRGVFQFRAYALSQECNFAFLVAKSQRDFADITWRRTSALFIGLPAMQLLLATHQRVFFESCRFYVGTGVPDCPF